MIARLSGTVLEKQPMRVVVDVGGVGYDVHVPLSSFSAIGEPGSTLALRVHTHVREDALMLFGFASQTELMVFERLIAVSGIGPRLALAVLSGLPPSDLVAAITRSDIAQLTRIPGIGKKTAERIVLELKDKLGASVAGEPAAAAAGPREDLLSALVNLGYHRPTAEKAVDDVLKSDPDAAFEIALRATLKRLSR
jgi:holliday junction DNA helicase RuvA